MRRKFCILLSLLIILIQCGCTQDLDYTPKEQPHLYYKDIDVVVEQVNRKHWFAGTHWYEVKIRVKSEEYNLTYSTVLKSSGMFRPKQWDYSEGDIIRAELYSLVMDSTGEVIERKIHRIY